jgi:myo-inositol-1(or 4)-monophosphatase
MNTTTNQSNTRTDNSIATDRALLPGLVSVVQTAAEVLLSRYGTSAPPRDIAELVSALGANDTAVLATLRGDLRQLRPDAGWVEDEGGVGPLPPGEWWVTDPAEGNINHAHGLIDWAVTATLVRDNVAVLTVVDQPQLRRTYTAVRGAGAWLNGRLLSVSAKIDLAVALVGTGQAVPGESVETYRRMGRSITAMLQSALVVKVSVPATLPLLDVAAGRTEAFWQHSQVRSGLLAGALLVAEAGGAVTDLRGQPWTVDSVDFLAATPGIHPAAVDVLAGALAAEPGSERAA